MYWQRRRAAAQSAAIAPLAPDQGDVVEVEVNGGKYLVYGDEVYLATGGRVYGQEAEAVLSEVE